MEVGKDAPGCVTVKQEEFETRTQVNSNNRSSFWFFFTFILNEVDKDKQLQLEQYRNKLLKKEISRELFMKCCKSIVSERVLKLAAFKAGAKGLGNPGTRQSPSQYHAQSQSSSQQQLYRLQAATAATDPYSFGQMYEKSQNSPATAATSCVPTSMAPLQINSSRSLNHMSDYCGMYADKMRDFSVILTQGLSNQQQEHIHSPQSSFPMCGPGSPNPYAGINVNTTLPMVRSQSLESQLTLGQVCQRSGSTHSDPMSQAANVMIVPKVEWQDSICDLERVVGATLSMPTAVSVPLVNVKLESMDMAPETQPKWPTYSSHGPKSLGAVNVDQRKEFPGTSIDGVSPTLRLGGALTPSTRTADLQTASVSPMNVTSFNAKVSAKKPRSGQKKLHESHSSPPTIPSKKQKISGDFSNQSIEHQNDVIANSGLDIHEEECHLFSGAKNDGGVSEASRKAVQEEEKMLLQKTTLRKKLAEIMAKFGLKNLGSDVERCLSLCVEERLRGLISSLMSVSKQRVDSGKSRHDTIVTSDIREQILVVNQKAKEEEEKKQSETEKLWKTNEPRVSTGINGEKQKRRCKKSVKANKEDDKMCTTVANVAARVAIGGDDSLVSKWQLMAETARQNSKARPHSLSTLQAEKGMSGMVTQLGRSHFTAPPPVIARTVSMKDLIAVLERDPHMTKSTILYRLFEKMR